MAGLTLVILCTDRLHAAVAIWGQDVLERLRFWVAYLGGVAACAIGLYQGTAPLFIGSLTPTVPLATLLAAIALGFWCGAQSRPERFVLPHVAGCALILGMVLSLRGVSLPQTTLAVYGSVALVGLLWFGLCAGRGGQPWFWSRCLLCITVPMLPACCAKVSHSPSPKPRH